MAEWSDDMISQLRVLWNQGVPTKEIGEHLGVSKNAVIGKVNRLGDLKRRASIINNTAPKGPRRVMSKTSGQTIPKLPSEKKAKAKPMHTIQGPKSAPNPAPVQAAPQAKPTRGCRWLYGKRHQWRECGEETVDGTWCCRHRAKVFAPRAA